MKRSGFTIVELIVVIVVIGILAAISFVSYNGIQRDARDKALLSDMDSLDSLMASQTIKDGGTPEPYYSGSSSNTITFTPSQGNVMDVTTAGVNYCIRGWNPASNKDSVTNAYTKGSTPEACTLTDASIEAGGTGGKIMGWYKLNGGAVDSSGQGHDGTVNGATLTAGQNGDARGAYSFSDIAVNGIDTGYNFPYDTLSVSAWVKWSGTSLQSFGSIVSNARDYSSPYNGVHFEIIKSNAQLRNYFWWGSANSNISYTTIPSGTWVHVAATYNGQRSAMYVNGQEVASATFSQSLGASVYNMQIGRGGWTNGYSFGGDIDDVRIYDYGLSAETVEAIYNMGAL